MFSKEDLVRAHAFCTENREALLADSVCGCFHCGKIFTPSEITDWLKERKPDGNREGNTAKCPFCGIDSVIGSHAGYPINREFLDAMNAHWFGNNQE